MSYAALNEAAVVRGGVAEVRTGGDLMADSSPEREEQESRLKTLSLWRAFGLEAAAAAVGMAPASAEDRIAVPAEVRLLDAQDPFGNGMCDCLLGLGLCISPGARVALLIGAADVPGRPTRHLVAVGDAAVSVLLDAGFATQPAGPEHGRQLLCSATAIAPWRGTEVFIAARYASLRLESDDVPVGWEVWAVDAQGHPVALGHRGRRLACLLFRPDSLLSQPQALQALRAALAFAAGRTPR